MCRAISTPAGPYKPSDTVDVEIVRKKGIDLIHDPLYNKVYACNLLNTTAHLS